jgi:hypothetical protein
VRIILLQFGFITRVHPDGDLYVDMGSLSRTTAKRFYQYVRMLVSSCYRTLVSAEKFREVLPPVESIERSNQALPKLLSLQSNKSDELTSDYIREQRFGPPDKELIYLTNSY